MSKTWLICDVHYLAWRAFHTTGTLSHRGMATGVLYGFFDDLVRFQKQFEPDGMAFCFDSKHSLRLVELPCYKETRRSKVYTAEEQQAYRGMRRQLRMLRNQYLPELGYRNIFHKNGYESDDLIASLCLNMSMDDQAVVVSSDQDLYQLLCPRVSIFNPHTKRHITDDSFKDQYGIEPTQWADVKAIAGCHSDDVPGIDGIGEKSAIDFLTGKLKGKRLERIHKCNGTWRANLRFVQLPFEKTPKLVFKTDKFSIPRWRELTTRLGMKSLRDKSPVPTRVLRSRGRG
jgi:DNA polymerase I